jgi:hypothetical protein
VLKGLYICGNQYLNLNKVLMLLYYWAKIKSNSRRLNCFSSSQRRTGKVLRSTSELWQHGRSSHWSKSGTKRNDLWLTKF